MEVVDSFRVHEEIKLGRPGREQLIPQYVATLRNLAASGIKVVCYNFMPVFDWTRTQMDYALPDGSNTLSFESARVEALDVSKGIPLPGGNPSYPGEAAVLARRIRHGQYGADVAQSGIFSLASRAGRGRTWAEARAARRRSAALRVRAAAHHQEYRGSSPRARYCQFKSERTDALQRTLGSDLRNDVPMFINEFAARQRVHFVHLRNVKVSANGDFYESAHPTECGSLDMAEIMKALHDADFQVMRVPITAA